MNSNFLFIELAALQDGRTFDGLAVGTFTDMYGRSVTVKPDELPTYLANTQAAIEATRTEGGELVGLPIDAHGHEKGDGAGWIVGVELADSKLRLSPQWTDIGQDIIGRKIRRFFSATIDLVNKVILGGTLTNWPASRDKSGRVLLRPIELSQELQQLELGGDARNTNFREVSMNPDELQGLIDQAVQKALAALTTAGANQQPPPEQGGESNNDLIASLGLGHLSEEAAKRLEAQLSAHFATIQKTAELSYMQKLAALNRKRELAEMSQRLTGGTEESPRGLPVTADALTEALVKLPADQQPFWIDLCEKVVKGGVVEFRELGHSKQQKGVSQLPADVAAQLDAGTLKISDLSHPIMGSFLGDLTQYDLSKWGGK